MAKVHGVVDPKKSLKDEANMQPSSDTICDIMGRDVKPDISASPDNLNGDIKLEIKPDPDHLPKEIISELHLCLFMLVYVVSEVRRVSLHLDERKKCR